MKQNIIMIIILIGLFIFGLLIYDFSDELNKDITDNSWYVFDNDELNVVKFKDNTFSYASLKDGQSVSQYKSCKTFRYNRSINVVKLNCSVSGNKIYISSVDKNVLTINIDGKDKILYSSEKLAREAKFIADNNLTQDDYNDLINVDYSLFNSVGINDLSALIKEKSINYIAFINDNINYENLFNYMALENIAKNNTIYVINTSSLSSEDVKILNGLYDDFSLNIEDYIKNEIDVYSIGNKKILYIDSIDIKTMQDAKSFMLEKIGN